MMIFLFAYLTYLIYAIYAWTNMLCLKKFEMDLYCKDYLMHPIFHRIHSFMMRKFYVNF